MSCSSSRHRRTPLSRAFASCRAASDQHRQDRPTAAPNANVNAKVRRETCQSEGGHIRASSRMSALRGEHPARHQGRAHLSDAAIADRTGRPLPGLPRVCALRRNASDRANGTGRNDRLLVAELRQVIADLRRGQDDPWQERDHWRAAREREQAAHADRGTNARNDVDFTGQSYSTKL